MSLVSLTHKIINWKDLNCFQVDTRVLENSFCFLSPPPSPEMELPHLHSTPLQKFWLKSFMWKGSYPREPGNRNLDANFVGSSQVVSWEVLQKWAVVAQETLPKTPEKKCALSNLGTVSERERGNNSQIGIVSENTIYSILINPIAGRKSILTFISFSTDKGLLCITIYLNRCASGQLLRNDPVLKAGIELMLIEDQHRAAWRNPQTQSQN